MRPTSMLRAANARQPMIKFLGKRSHPKNIDHTPQAHPASPTHELPSSFASYRQKATQHGPLGGGQQGSGGPTPSSSSVSSASSSSALSSLSSTARGGPMTYGAIGGKSGRSLGSIKPKDGEFFDVSELPRRFQKRVWTEEEMDATNTGGASMW